MTAPLMTADAIVRRRFSDTPWVCATCGFYDEVRVVANLEANLYRWSRVECLCGAVLARVIPPPVLVPYGKLARVPLTEVDTREIQWLHETAKHPWVLAACCRLLGCGGCVVSYKEQMAKIQRPLKRVFREARAHRPAHQP
jgi:hypothetical protein